MVQPRFTWWPWRILALSVPWLAFGGALAASRQIQVANRFEQDEQVLRVLVAIYAGGTGLLLGAAIGDLGRSMLAMFVGTGMALMVAPYCVLGLGLLFVPLVVGSVTGCLALEADLDGIVAAMLAGVVDFLMGLILALPVLVVTLVLGAVIGAADDFMPVALAAYASVANLLFVGKMFKRAHRVRGEDSPAGTEKPGQAAALEEPEPAEEPGAPKEAPPEP